MTDIKEGPFIGDKSIREILGTAPEPPRWVRIHRCGQCSGPDCYIIRHGEQTLGACRRAMPADWQPDAPEPSPSGRSTATEKVCDHSGIGLPDCETCDPNTARNQDCRRRGRSPICIDCGSRGELVEGAPSPISSVRWCSACDVNFGWMVPATVGSGPRPTCLRPDPTFPAHLCILSAGHPEPCDWVAVP